MSIYDHRQQFRDTNNINVFVVGGRGTYVTRDVDDVFVLRLLSRKMFLLEENSSPSSNYRILYDMASFANWMPPGGGMSHPNTPAP
eukprot:1180983-Prorocentrum_minimum.AAC.6